MDKVEIGSRIGQLARHAMNYADDKMRKMVRGNEYEDLHNSLTSVLSRVTNTMASLNVNIETLQEAQQKYYKSLADGDKEEQDNNKRIIKTLEELVALQDSSDRKDLFDKVFKRKRVSREEATRILEYSKQIATLTSKLSEHKQITPDVVIKQMQDTIKDIRLDGHYRHQVLEDLQEFLQEESLGSKELRDRIDTILKRDKRVDYSEVQPLVNILDDILSEVSKENNINDFVTSLEDADLSDSQTHKHLETLVSIMSGVKSLENEQAFLTQKLVEGIGNNEEELNAVRQVLRRVADETVETKTLHTLQTLSHQFDRAIMNTEQLEDALQEKQLEKKFELNPALVSKGRDLMGNIIAGIMQSMGLGDLNSLLGISDYIADNLGVAAASVGAALLGVKKMVASTVSKVASLGKAMTKATASTPTTKGGSSHVTDPPNTTKGNTAKGTTPKGDVPKGPKKLEPGSIVDSHKTKASKIRIKGGGFWGKAAGAAIGLVSTGYAANAVASEISERRQARLEAASANELSEEDLPLSMLDLTNSVDHLNETLSKGIALDTSKMTAGDGAMLAGAGIAGVGATALGVKALSSKLSTAPALALESAQSVAPNTAKLAQNASHMIPAKAGAGAILKTAGKAIPVIGNVASWGLDAYNFATAESTAERKEYGSNVAASMGGAWAGAQLGAAVGSVVPGIGTAIGGIIGGIAGSLGGSWLGDKLSGLFMDPEDYIPDSYKKAGPLAEYIAGMELISRPDSPLDKEGKDKLKVYLDKLMSLSNVKSFIMPLLNSPELKDIPANARATALLNAYGSQLASLGVTVPENLMNDFATNVHKLLDVKDTQMSDAELKARRELGKTESSKHQPSYWGYTASGSPSSNWSSDDIALASVFDKTTNSASFNRTIAEQGARGLETLKRQGATAEVLRNAELQLENQRGLTLSEFANLNKYKVTTLENGTKRVDPKLSTELGKYAGEQVPMAVTPLIGISANMNIDNSKENNIELSFDDMLDAEAKGNVRTNGAPGSSSAMGIGSTALGGTMAWGSLGGSPVASSQGGGSALGDGDIDRTNVNAIGRFGDVKALLTYGMQFIGRVEYSQTGPRDPKMGSADCSSFVKACLEDVWGVKGVPGNSEAQFTWKKGRIVKYNDLKPGDLVFFNHPAGFAKNRPIGISHVGFYAGGGEILHCSGRKGVNIMKLEGSYLKFFYAGKRLTESGGTATNTSVLSAPGSFSTADLSSGGLTGGGLAFDSTGGVPMAPQFMGEQPAGYQGALSKYIRQGDGSFDGNINGLSQQEMSNLAATLAQRESSGNQFAENKWGYLGLYQFGAAALADAGLIDMNKYRAATQQNPGIADGSDAKAHKAFLANPSNWTIAGGKDAFLMNKSMQDRALSTLMNKNKATMERRGVTFSSSGDLGGMLLGAHLKGVGNAINFKTKGIDSVDGNGTKLSSYYDLGAKATVTGTGVPLSVAQIPNNPQTPSASLLVEPQSIASPKYALQQQSILKGQAQGASVNSANNTANPIIIPPSTQSDVGQLQPKTNIDDAGLLIASNQLFS